MHECDDLSGNQDGYTGKMLHPAEASGRQANWESVDRLMQVLFPGGVRVSLKPLKRKMLAQASINNSRPSPPRKTAYMLTPEKAREMAELRKKSLSEWQRSVIARRAARRRWRDKRLEQIRMKEEIKQVPLRALTPTQSR